MKINKSVRGSKIKGEEKWQIGSQSQRFKGCHYVALPFHGLLKKNFFKRGRERACVHAHAQAGEGQRERESQVGCMLNEEPNVGLDPTILGS